MSDWRSIQTAIPKAVKQVLGKKFDVGWTDREARWRKESHCRLRIIGQEPLGRTELRRTDNGDGSFTERAYSPAALTIQFTFVSQDQDLYESALPDAEAVSNSLRRSDVFEVICASGLGISNVSGLNVVDFKDQHGRWRSSVNFDVRFNTHITSVTGFGRTGDFVEQVEVTGDIEGITLDLLVDGS